MLGYHPAALLMRLAGISLFISILLTLLALIGGHGEGANRALAA
jgi:hypothetical protein